MNKKTFIGATLITATVVGGVVYFRHKILNQVDKFLGEEGESQRRIEEVLEKAREMGTVIRTPGNHVA